MRQVTNLLLTIFIIGLSGCGYTTGSLLPTELDSIHVENFSNAIDPTREMSDRRASYSYRPGLEGNITRAVIDEFIFDGTLKIDNAKQSDLLLRGEFHDFRQFPLSYDGGDNVEEFRVELQVDIELYNKLTGDTLWKENNFVGQTSYTVSGLNAKTENEGVNAAVKDLAQRIVERTVEAW